MKLLTKEIEQKLEHHPIGSQDKKGKDAEVVVKFFSPVGAGTWLITEAEKQNNDWLMYGYCYITDWEWGYVSFNELKNVKLPFGLSIERDLYAEGTVAELSRY
jgi:hypothetical protein